jgi:hypothetical protein
MQFGASDLSPAGLLLDAAAHPTLGSLQQGAGTVATQAVILLG